MISLNTDSLKGYVYAVFLLSYDCWMMSHEMVKKQGSEDVFVFCFF